MFDLLADDQVLIFGIVDLDLDLEFVLVILLVGLGSSGEVRSDDTDGGRSWGRSGFRRRFTATEDDRDRFLRLGDR